MKKFFYLLSLLTIASINSYAQAIFESGYFIKNNGQRTLCLIRNDDWINTPSQIKYKLSESSETESIAITELNEFRIGSSTKFIKRNIEVDETTEISDFKNPTYKRKDVILRVLVEGKANLYSYSVGNQKIYFIKIDDSEIQQLVYRKFRVSNNQIQHNQSFKQKLWTSLNSSCIKKEEIENLDYRENDLITVLKKYHSCNNEEVIIFEKDNKGSKLGLSLRPGIKHSSFSINNNRTNYQDANFGSKIGVRIGVEVEVLLGFQQNKWAIFTEPTYQYFKDQEPIVFNNTATLDYKSIELPIGVRRYFYLNENSKIFVNGALLLDFSGNSNIDFDNYGTLDIKTGFNFAFGLGVKHKNKYSLEFRYQTPRDIFFNYQHWSNENYSFSAIFGYKVF